MRILTYPQILTQTLSNPYSPVNRAHLDACVQLAPFVLPEPCRRLRDHINMHLRHRVSLVLHELEGEALVAGLQVQLQRLQAGALASCIRAQSRFKFPLCSSAQMISHKVKV